MKRPILEDLFMLMLLVAIALFMTACGGKGGGSDSSAPGQPAITCNTLAGGYYDQYTPSQTLTVSNSCTFTDSVCGYTASYTIPDRQTGATVVTVANTNGTPGCMSNTSHMCVMEYNGVQLGINCDNGAHLYLFIRQ